MHQAPGLGVLFFRVTERDPVELLYVPGIHLQYALIDPGAKLGYFHLPLPYLAKHSRHLAQLPTQGIRHNIQVLVQSAPEFFCFGQAGFCPQIHHFVVTRFEVTYQISSIGWDEFNSLCPRGQINFALFKQAGNGSEELAHR